MAADITEEFQVDLSKDSPTSLSANAGTVYDYAFNDKNFFDASSPERPYVRQTAQYRKDQSDNSSEPGEQTLTGWWLRSQSSFHFGSGINFYEPIQDDKLRFRFADSQGVNVWRQGQLTLLRNTVQEHHIIGSLQTYMRPVKWGNVNGALMLDNEDVDKVFPTITNTITFKSLTSNVAELTTGTVHGFTTGMEVVITGVDATFNGTYTVTAVPTTTTFRYDKTATNVSVTAVSPVGAVSTNVAHFIDHNTGSDTAVYSICDDGINAYWVTNQASGGTKCEIFRKNLNGYASDPAYPNVSMYLDNAVHADTAVIEYVKGRLIAAINNIVYELNPAATGTTNLTGLDVFTHSNSTYKFTDITESGSNIYISGYSGISSSIHMLSVSTSGATAGEIAGLSGAVTVAEMPRGETINTIQYYLGYMLIGTSRGVRVAQVLDNGALVYGPLLFESAQPVYQFATSDHYAWCTTKIDGDAGLIRIDLGTQIDTLVFPYANDLQAVGQIRNCTGVAFLGESDRLAFTTSNTGTNGAVWIESASVLRPSGYVTTGKIRFNTSENKFFKYVKERADYPGGTITVGTTSANIVVVNSNNGNQDIGISETAAVEFKSFVFTLSRSTEDTTIGPIMYGYQIKALPATRKQRIVQYNVWCFDHEVDKYRNRTGYVGRAFERLQSFEDLEATSDIITVQDFRTGETFQALIEEQSFKATAPPSGAFNGYGGILTVTVRKI